MRRVLALAGLLLVLPAVARAADAVVVAPLDLRATAVTGWPAPFATLHVLRYAATVSDPHAVRLVLMPGTFGGAGDFDRLARSLVVGGGGRVEVWSMERREAALADRVALDRARAASSPLGAAFTYLLADGTGRNAYQVAAARRAPAVRQAGLAMTMTDLRTVVLRARRGGHRMVLGGHSLGGMLTQLYAAWDFGGHAGARDIAGMLLIDGSVPGRPGPTATTSRRFAAAMTAIRRGATTLTAFGLPSYIFGPLAEIAGGLCVTDPGGAGLASLLPDGLRPVDTYGAVLPLSNAALIGYETSPLYQTAAPFFSIQSGAGLVPGDPYTWDGTGAITPVAAMCAALWGRTGGGFLDWYEPARLHAEVDAASDLATTRGWRARLGLRVRHRGAYRGPVVAFAAGGASQAFLDGYRWYRTRVATPRSRFTIVHVPTYRHLDPVIAPGSALDAPALRLLLSLAPRVPAQAHGGR